MLEGPAGIGKTVLLAAARDAARGRGFRVLRGRGAELEREFGFGVVRQLVEPVVAGAPKEEGGAWLLDGPPGVAARLSGVPGLGDGIAWDGAGRSGPDVRGLARAVLAVRQAGGAAPARAGGR